MIQVLNCTRDQITEIAVDEAIRRLGLLHPSARTAIMTMMKDDQGQHPRSLCTAYRKAGDQITKEELKAIGLRASAFMSREALADLTDIGLEKPLEAHVDTLLRSYFTVSRWRSFQATDELVRQGVSREAIVYKYSMLPPVCDCCNALNGEPTTPETAHILAPDDCECVTANYSIQQRIDWFYDLD
ncbi:MAG: hypothetical protein A3K57_04685 [Caulobacterales bacterium RIFOXYA1_FULL_67_7]|nr:MAG: hypothetical protein A3K57_04685 [Caulobacterales bacterium RIFOXYA1_FULL_67_7]